MKNQRRTIAVAIFLFLSLVCARQPYAAGTKNFAAYSKKVDAWYQQYLKYYEKKQYVPAYKKLNAIVELLAGDPFVTDWRSSHDIKPSQAEFEALLAQLKMQLSVQETSVPAGQITQLSQEIGQQKQGLADEKNKLEEKIKTLAREKKQLADERDNLQKALTTGKLLVDSLHARVVSEKHLAGERDKLQKELAQKQSQLDELKTDAQEQKRRLDAERDRLQKELVGKQSLLDKLEKDIGKQKPLIAERAALQKELANTQSHLNKLEKDIQEQQRLTNQQSQKGAQEQKRLGDERDSLQKELVDQQSLLDKLQKDAEEQKRLSDERDLLKTQFADNQDKVDRLQKRVARQEKLADECTTLQQKLSEKQSQLESMATQAEKTAQETAQIQEELQQKQSSLEQSAEKLRSVEQEKDLAEKTFALEKSLMQEKLAAHEAQLKTLTQQVKQQQVNVGAVKTARAPLKKGGSLLARLSAKPKKGYSPLEVKFYGDKSFHSTGRIVSYIWDFDDGLNANEMNPVHTFMVYQPRSFNVTLTVKDEAGNTATETTVITVLCARE
jgi:DNA repair exonuclease SbcCD ATPase subunit